MNTKSILPRLVGVRAIERSGGRDSFETCRTTRSTPLHRWEINKTKRKKEQKYGPKRREYGKVFIFRDSARERSSSRMLSSPIGRFCANGRHIGRYSRHTFELQCKRTSVEPYTYSMLLYLKWWKWWQLNVVSVHFYIGRGCISEDEKKRNTLDAADKNKGATYS